MKKYPVLVLLLIIMSSVTTFRPAWAAHSILLLGDSVSASYGMKQNEGWVHLLNDKLKQQNASYYIHNASISGETTAGGLSRLPGILSTEKIDYLIIELGGNDGLRGFSPKLIKNNLLQTIALAQEKKIKVSLIKIKITPNYGPRYNKMFEQVFIDVAKETNIELIPFFMEQIVIKPELMQADGIHPNKKAQPLIADIVAQQLEQLISNK